MVTAAPERPAVYCAGCGADLSGHPTNAAAHVCGQKATVIDLTAALVASLNKRAALSADAARKEP